MQKLSSNNSQLSISNECVFMNSQQRHEVATFVFNSKFHQGGIPEAKINQTTNTSKSICLFIFLIHSQSRKHSTSRDLLKEIDLEQIPTKLYQTLQQRTPCKEGYSVSKFKQLSVAKKVSYKYLIYIIYPCIAQKLNFINFGLYLYTRRYLCIQVLV